MPRPVRLVLPGQVHHVIQRGNNRQPIFFEDRDRRLFLTMLGDALAAHRCALHAYVLMTNHVHLLITPEGEAGIASVMQSVGRRYVAHINRTHQRTGTLWEGRFRSTIVDSEAWVMACYRYIEANPIRAGMVTAPEDHPWSSHGRNAHGRPDPLVEEQDCYTALGDTAADRQAAYRAHFEDLAPDTIDTLRDATQRGWVPGRVAAPTRGRPRKTAINSL